MTPTGRDTSDWQFDIVEYRDLVAAGYMSTDPKLRQEVYGDGDNITGNAMEPGGWSLADDAHKPGRLWTGKSFWINPIYEAAAIENMFAKCH